MSLEKIESISQEMLFHMDSIKNLYREINDMEFDVKHLLAMLKVKVKVYPGQKVYRLSNQRLRGHGMIQYDHELAKKLEEFIEESGVNSVFFKEKRLYDKNETVVFEVEYVVHGYYEHNNRYSNDDFGVCIWTSRAQLIKDLAPVFEMKRKEYIQKKEADRIAEKEKLERQLRELTK